MKAASLRSIALVASVAIGASPVAADDASTKSAPMSHGWEFSEQGGADLFRNICAGCHQADAKGAVGAGAYPPLAEDGELASTDLMLSALLGGLKSMPPVGAMMTDAQVADVVNYVRTHFGNSYKDPVSAEAVSAARRRAASAP
jgi:mono/diheme cytochrome c family protein